MSGAHVRSNHATVDACERAWLLQHRVCHAKTLARAENHSGALLRHSANYRQGHRSPSTDSPQNGRDAAVLLHTLRLLEPYRGAKAERSASLDEVCLQADGCDRSDDQIRNLHGLVETHDDLADDADGYSLASDYSALTAVRSFGAAGAATRAEL